MSKLARTNAGSGNGESKLVATDVGGWNSVRKFTNPVFLPTVGAWREGLVAEARAYKSAPAGDSREGGYGGWIRTEVAAESHVRGRSPKDLV